VYDFLSREDCKEHDIFLLSADGSRGRLLVQHPADDWRPAWTPDGKKVLFASDRTGSWGFWAIAVADGEPQGQPELVKADIGHIRRSAGFTRQGALYYSVNAGREDVYVAETDPATGKLAAPPVRVASRFEGFNMAPAWSPDGASLAYLSQRGQGVLYQPGALTIVIRSLQTGEEHDLAANLNQMIGPVRWFPDGRSLLVGGWEGSYRDERAAFFRVDAQTGAASLVKRVGRAADLPHLSPDGKTIFYWQQRSEDRSRKGLMVYQIDTREEKEIYAVTGSYWAALALSPDSRELAVAHWDEATQSSVIKLVPATGGQPRELLRVRATEGIHPESRIEWTPDGRFLLVARRAKEGQNMTELWRVPVQGGEPQRIGLAMERIRFPSVHPDGRRIAFDAGSWLPRRLELWVMENFLPELKAAR
jgi:Tol biopolymer transport system component